MLHCESLQLQYIVHMTREAKLLQCMFFVGSPHLKRRKFLASPLTKAINAKSMFKRTPIRPRSAGCSSCVSGVRSQVHYRVYRYRKSKAPRYRFTDRASTETHVCIFATFEAKGNGVLVTIFLLAIWWDFLINFRMVFYSWSYAVLFVDIFLLYMLLRIYICASTAGGIGVSFTLLSFPFLCWMLGWHNLLLNCSFCILFKYKAFSTCLCLKLVQIMFVRMCVSFTLYNYIFLYL